MGEKLHDVAAETDHGRYRYRAAGPRSGATTTSSSDARTVIDPGGGLAMGQPQCQRFGQSPSAASNHTRPGEKTIPQLVSPRSSRTMSRSSGIR